MKYLSINYDSIDSTVEIKCKNSKIGKNSKIFANNIMIGDNVIIGEGVKIFSENVIIGDNSQIDDRSNIFAIEKFELGRRSNLCLCDIKGRRIKIGDDFFSSVPSGEKLTIGGGAWSYPKSILIIGDRCTVHDIFINIAMQVEIGNDVGISQKTSFFTHYFWNSIFEGYPQKFEGVKINDGCIIGANSIFLPGTKIGKNSVIGAGSIITKKFPSDCIIGGNPAKIIKKNIKKNIPTKNKLQLLKNSIQWYVEILQTKGFTVKSQKGINHVLIKNKKKIILCYDDKSKKSNYRRIVLTFEPIKPIKNETIINLNKKTIEGKEDEITDDLRDFLRKIGIRIFTKRKFNSIKYEVNFQLE